MLHRSILAFAVLGTLAFAAAAQADTMRPTGTNLIAQIDGVIAGPGKPAGGQIGSGAGPRR